MGFHTYPAERAEELEDPSRYRYCSREELLELLAPSTDDVVADLGAGTGFYSRDVAPFVDSLLAVDVQTAMGEFHCDRGTGGKTALLTAAIGQLPVRDGRLDAAFSVMTHHEYADAATLEEIGRTLRPGGRLVTVDWSATGSGEDGPPLAERYAPGAVVDQLETAGFAPDTVRDRPETFAIRATA